MEHNAAALRALRERLDSEGGEISDPTLLVVVYLASCAEALDDLDTACHHMKGLRKMVDLRGGLLAPGNDSRLVLKVLE